MKTTPELLHQVQIDNIRDHQIGEIEDGISWDVAKDIGFLPTEQVVELIQDMGSQPARPLTSAEKNRNAAKHVAEHLKRTNKQVIDPNYG